MNFEYVRHQFHDWVKEIAPGISNDQKFWAAQAFMSGWAGGLMHGISLTAPLPDTAQTSPAEPQTHPPTDPPEPRP